MFETLIKKGKKGKEEMKKFDERETWIFQWNKYKRIYVCVYLSFYISLEGSFT